MWEYLLEVTNPQLIAPTVGHTRGTFEKSELMVRYAESTSPMEAKTISAVAWVPSFFTAFSRRPCFCIYVGSASFGKGDALSRREVYRCKLWQYSLEHSKYVYTALWETAQNG